MKCHRTAVIILGWYQNHLVPKTAKRINFLKFGVLIHFRADPDTVVLIFQLLKINSLTISEFKYIYIYTYIGAAITLHMLLLIILLSSFIHDSELKKKTWRNSTIPTCASLVAIKGCGQQFQASCLPYYSPFLPTHFLRDSCCSRKRNISN